MRMDAISTTKPEYEYISSTNVSQDDVTSFVYCCTTHGTLGLVTVCR